jgi:Beta-lactamase enzyme family
MKLGYLPLLILAARAVAGELDAVLDPVQPDARKWACVCRIESRGDGALDFQWQDYRGTADALDFWPASTIKLYAVIAALELLHERGFDLDATLTFEHRNEDETWTLDCARTIRELISEVFRRSSNEDYTLLLRFVGIDRMNTKFLTPERGFPHSALMRGYVIGRPWEYRRAEPQRITVRALDGKTDVIEHTWSGRFYAEERGATVIDSRTGNVTSPRELAECLRRVLFAEHLPEAERYRLSAMQLAFLREGGDGLTGLETRVEESDPIAWTDGANTVFPNARFFHKCGWISNFALEVACVDDRAHSGRCFILVPVVAVGEKAGTKIVSQMARAIAESMR